MPEYHENIRELIVAVSLALYGLYTIATGLVIIFFKRKILDPAKYFQLMLMELSGNHEKVREYKEQLLNEKNWPQYGKFVLVIGIVCLIFAFNIWRTFY